MTKKLFLPIGVDDFKSVKADCYYVDKTLFLEDIIYSPESSTFLFARPRRFGKSLMLSMCKYFFDINEDSLNLFKDTKIINNDNYLKYINKYNVVHLNLKGLSGDSFNEFIETIRIKMSDLYSDLLTPSSKYENSILNRNCSIAELKQSLFELTKSLYKKNNQKTVILIDEYDTPLENAFAKGFFSETRDFLKDFLGNVLKGNIYLYKAVVTGITQVAHSSIFSDLNNLMVNNILSNKKEYFGFTHDETIKLLNYFNFNGDINEVEKWYGGYIFQNQEIYNPWSILNFVSNIFMFKPYWVNTGSYRLLKETIKMLENDVNEELVALTNGEVIDSKISETTNYEYLDNTSNLYSLLCFSGYLSVKRNGPSNYYSLKIVNEEIHLAFNSEIMECLVTKNNFVILKKIRDSFLNMNIEEFVNNISYYVLDRLSYLDLTSEKAYQITIVTIASILMDDAVVNSEMESGTGRCDIFIKSIKNNDFSIIIELKYRKNRPSQKELNDGAVSALNQIKKHKYYEESKKIGSKKTVLLGLCFSRKKSAYCFEIL